LKLTYQKDTLLQGKEVKKWVMTHFQYIGIPPNLVRTPETFVDNHYLYRSGDSILWYHNNQFQLLYLFTPTIGLRWVVRKNHFYTCLNSISDTNTTTVSNIREIRVGGALFRELTLTPQAYWSIGTQIIQNIGSIQNPFPVPIPSGCRPVGHVELPEYLACYADRLRGSINFGGIGNCDQLLAPIEESVIDSKQIRTPFQIAPNPVKEVLSIINPHSLVIQEMRILDMYGHEYLKISPASPVAIDAHALPTGMYVAILKTADNHSYSIKFIKIQ
jgi:hypothetical protein